MGWNPGLTAYRAGSAVARALPESVALSMTSVLSGAVARISPERRLIVERNLRRVHGPEIGDDALRRAVRSTFQSYGRYWVESFRLPDRSPDELDERFSQEGLEHIQEATASGVGPIVALPHLGGWEWAGFWLAEVHRIPITVVVEALEPPELFDWFADFRRALGMNIVPLGPSAGSAVTRAIKDGHVVSLLSDRDITGGGVEVEFFGERTSLPAGPATLALRTGAPVLPTATYFEGRGHHVVIQPPMPVERQGKLRQDVARVTQDLAHRLEELIRVAPEQWHLMDPNWPSDREALAQHRPRWFRR